ncbi:ferredoxin [Nocardia cyriacigeorgica]|nr:ferredoxin [Nocardia cyriacigeorgica]
MVSNPGEGHAVEVDVERCAGHGRCCLDAPEIFGYDDNTGQAFVYPNADFATNTAEIDMAIDGCPEAAIRRIRP